MFHGYLHGMIAICKTLVTVVGLVGAFYPSQSRSSPVFQTSLLAVGFPGPALWKLWGEQNKVMAEGVPVKCPKLARLNIPRASAPAA